MREESAFDADAVSPADAYGLMQLIVPTARVDGQAVGLPSDARALKRPRSTSRSAVACSRCSDDLRDNPLLMCPDTTPGRAGRDAGSRIGRIWTSTSGSS